MKSRIQKIDKLAFSADSIHMGVIFTQWIGRLVSNCDALKGIRSFYIPPNFNCLSAITAANTNSEGALDQAAMDTAREILDYAIYNTLANEISVHIIGLREPDPYKMMDALVKKYGKGSMELQALRKKYGKFTAIGAASVDEVKVNFYQYKNALEAASGSTWGPDETLRRAIQLFQGSRISADMLALSGPGRPSRRSLEGGRSAPNCRTTALA